MMLCAKLCIFQNWIVDCFQMTKWVTEFELKVKTNMIKLNLLRNMIDYDFLMFSLPESLLNVFT